MLNDIRDWQPKYRPHMESKLRKVLRDPSYHTGVVRTRRQLAEVHRLSFHKKFDTKYPPTTKRIDNLCSYSLCLSQRCSRHRMWLPRLTVVAVLLAVADWLTK